MASTIRKMTVSFGLVSFEADLKKAAEKKDVSFDSAVRRKVGEKKGKPLYEYSRVKQLRGAMGSGGGIVFGDSDEIVKGVWVTDKEFHPIPDGALDKIAEATQIEGIEIEEFVKLSDVPWHRVEGAYYLTPQKGLIGAKPMRLLRDTLKAEKKAGVAKLCLKGTGGRQKLAVVHEADGMLLVNLLAFADDFRDADESAKSLENVTYDRKLLATARALVAQSTVAKSKLLDEAVDDAVAEKEKLYSATIDAEGYKVPEKREREAGPDDLLAALERSLAEVTT